MRSHGYTSSLTACCRKWFLVSACLHHHDCFLIVINASRHLLLLASGKWFHLNCILPPHGFTRLCYHDCFLVIIDASRHLLLIAMGAWFHLVSVYHHHHESFFVVVACLLHQMVSSRHRGLFATANGLISSLLCSASSTAFWSAISTFVKFKDNRSADCFLAQCFFLVEF